MKNISIVFILMMLAIACTKSDFAPATDSDERFFLKNGDAIMPVQVRGNTSSAVFCITLHGGPGDSGIQSFAATNSFDQVEANVAMVYFDQRCSGLSQGNCDAQALDISDFVDDVDKLIELLQSHYGEHISLFLMGHSWGATLALEYLISGQHRDAIAGCIQSNGSHSIPMVSREEKKILMQYATSEMQRGHSVEKWEEIKAQIQDRDTESFDDRIAIVEYCYKTLQPLIDADSVNAVQTKLDNYLRHLGNSFITSNNIRINNNRPFYEKILAYDISAELPLIETPIGLFWGRHDLVHPPIMAETIYSLIGSQEKEIFFFDRSHHAPMAHENELYQRKVMEFIDSHK